MFKKLSVFFVFLLAGLTIMPAFSSGGAKGDPQARYWVVVTAATREERTDLLELGFSIEEVSAESVGGICDRQTLDLIKQERRFKIIKESPLDIILEGFPSRDAAYHDVSETAAELSALASQKPDLVSVFSAGSSIQGRPIMVIRINADAKNDEPSAKPGVVFMGAHHAREHLSTEMPLLLAKYLVSQYEQDQNLKNLLNQRDVYIMPIVNPDGAEYDLENDKYRMWRKNVRTNSDGSKGVDLNRNYGYKWGTGGSSSSPGSETYMGTGPFSEPETQAVKQFVDARPNIKTMLSFHTFSELILYPWGNTYDPIADGRDKAVFEKMAKTMAGWNGYTPQQSSDLYIASGDTTDWAYGEHKIFAFTFELTPKTMWEGGFYPGAGVINSTFQANLNPSIYLITVAGDPYSVLEE
ncbi:MAG: zinc carboxypeptidase [Elusimicrobia bacterium]|nr:zinc carboxypeptidase [Elusimicrobiota bacterium]